MNVHFSPTRPNQQFVSMLRCMPEFKNCRFLPLSDRTETRSAQLQGMRGTAVFIWGDGYSHHDSFYFTRNSGAKLKINLDRHSDRFNGRLDFEFFKAKPVLDYTNHMSVSELDRVQAVSMEPAIVHMDNAPFEEMLAQARIRGSGFREREIAVTIDGDVFPNFPSAHPSWIKETGLGMAQVAGIVSELGSKIIRLDIGGIKENLPEFLFGASREIPERWDSMASGFEKEPLAQERVNRVGSYAFTAYMEVLGSFLESQGQMAHALNKGSRK